MTTMYERLGGHDTVKVAVSVFYTRVLADPLLEPYFEGIDLARLRSHQAAFLATEADRRELRLTLLAV